ncbi:hypothetical protein IQ255_30915 [Pleurocapsales cyanobacterium LEGE 10410]|nr:hypothetical protein [Pleurocapsales cyanobacterium LEGE 10410]
MSLTLLIDENTGAELGSAFRDVCEDSQALPTALTTSTKGSNPQCKIDRKVLVLAITR